MNKNLVTINKLKRDIEHMKLISTFATPKQKKQVEEIAKELDETIMQIDKFNVRFSDAGWCAYDSMNSDLIRKCNAELEKNGFESAERILIDYYKTDAKEIIYWIKTAQKHFQIDTSYYKNF